jgi:hypothetical protein
MPGQTNLVVKLSAAKPSAELLAARARCAELMAKIEALERAELDRWQAEGGR